MFILGLIMLVVGVVLNIGILVTLGIIFMIAGAVLFLVGVAGHPVGGRQWY